MENIIYSREFSDSKNRGKLWYFITISIVVGLCIWGVLTKNYGLSLIVILVTGVTFFIENNSPEMVQVFLNDKGIKINESFYEYEMIDTYSFIFEKENPIFLQLYLKKKGVKKILLRVDSEIHTHLTQLLPNVAKAGETEELSNIDRIIYFLKL